MGPEGILPSLVAISARSRTGSSDGNGSRVGKKVGEGDGTGDGVGGKGVEVGKVHPDRVKRAIRAMNFFFKLFFPPPICSKPSQTLV